MVPSLSTEGVQEEPVLVPSLLRGFGLCRLASKLHFWLPSGSNATRCRPLEKAYTTLPSRFVAGEVNFV